MKCNSDFVRIYFCQKVGGDGDRHDFFPETPVLN